jgi:SAM-dependent methyltransferase
MERESFQRDTGEAVAHKARAEYAHHQQPDQAARIEDLMGIIPMGRSSVLDVGARDGYISGLLRQFFPSVTALDLNKPKFSIERVETVQGDATNLQFPSKSFDVVVCAEVLEHVPNVERACSELMRVARYEIVIGVPYRQDTRVGRLTCSNCGSINPPYGHVNSFTEQLLANLFSGWTVDIQHVLGPPSQRTNGLSTWLRDRAGNPWGDYRQQEPCIRCGEPFRPPKQSVPLRKFYMAGALTLDRLQLAFVRPRPYWIHTVFGQSKT